MLLGGWATQARACLEAHDLDQGQDKPAPEAIRWAEQQADNLTANPSRYLNPARLAAFRQRLFGTTRQGRSCDDQEKHHD
ncbi:hypothetical protein DVW87_10085 [Sphingomonas aracearum]|uniref:Uncharacterized protein n=2 Tax=Sphingomonas aracearum TaxID=2283317 RepID=A0A369VWW7_9SPHN|nr:hypothetical protein DVW87_10085 [Sphingomonas aracearum]